MIRISGFIILVSFFLMMLAVAQWQLLGSILDHYFALLSIGLVVAGISLGFSLSGFVANSIKENDVFQRAAIFFCISALMEVAGLIAVYQLPLGTIPVFGLLLALFLLPYIFAGIAIKQLTIQNSNVLLSMNTVVGAAIALLASGIFIEVTQSAVVLTLVASAGLAVTAFIFSSRPLMPFILMTVLSLPGIMIYFVGVNSSLSPVWTEDTIKRAKPLYNNLMTAELASPPVTQWSSIGRTDKLAYKNKDNVHWYITNAAMPVPVIDNERTYSTDWWKARFPLTMLPLLLGKPQSYLSIGTLPGSELTMARQLGVKSIRGAGYNSLALMIEKEKATTDTFFQGTSIRHFIETENEQYDQIFVPLVQLTRGKSTFSNLEDSYLYTSEAFQRYYERLTPGGLMVVTAVDPRLYLKAIYTAWEGIGGDVRSRTWGMRMKSGTPMQTPYQFTFIIVKNTPPFDFIERMKKLINGMPVIVLFGSGFTPQQPFELLNRTGGFEKGREILTGFLSKRLQAWVDLEPATDDRPFVFQLMRKLDLQQKWVLGLGAAGLIYCFLYAVPALRRPDSKLHSEFAPIPVYLGYFAIHGAVMVGLAVAMLWRSILLLGFAGASATAVLLPWFIGIVLALVIGQKFVFNGNRNILNIILPLTVIALLGVSYAGVTTYAVSLMGWSIPLVGFAIALLSFSLAFMMSLSFGYGLNQLFVDLPDVINWAWAGFGFAALIGIVLVILLGKMWGWTGVWSAAVLGYLFVMSANFWLWHGRVLDSPSGEQYG